MARIFLAICLALALAGLPEGVTAQIGAPTQPAVQYYYSHDGKPAGPFGLDDIKAKIAAGEITPDTLVWRTGMTAWVPARQLADLAGLFGGPARADLRQFFLGTWSTEAPGPEGTVGLTRLVLTATADGKLKGSYTFTLESTNKQQTVDVAGVWKIQPTGPKQFILDAALTMTIDGDVQSSTATTTLEIVDDNTLREVDTGILSHRIGK